VTAVLLVDDDAFVLDALSDVIAARRPAWDVMKASTTQGALLRLSGGDVDAVVVDIGLDEDDGVDTLERVRKDFPGVFRAVLSGTVDLRSRSRAAVAAHRYLSKPCDSTRLIEIIEQSLSVRGLLHSPSVRAVLGEIGSLPAAPGCYAALTRALEDPRTPLSKIAAIVEQDVAICAKVMQFANSGLFSLGRPISDVQSAVGYLGLELLRALVLSAGALRLFQPRDGQRFSAFALAEHGLAVAEAARSLADGRLPTTDVFVTAMLHDIGKLVLATYLPLQFEAAATRAEATKRPIHFVERELYGYSHAEVGAYLLGLWGLPSAVVEAVAFHHDPGLFPHDSLHLIDVIAAGDFIVRRTLVHDDAPNSLSALDLSHLRPSQKPQVATTRHGGGPLE
jgi:HD-like signal output (HDOD) protein/ActR/RegA family two-component response regulator